MKSDPIELWNVRDEVPTYVGAQRIVNILGRLSNVDDVEYLSYSLNDGPRVPVFFASRAWSANRLAHLGDFNIDTVERGQLKAENRLTPTIQQKDGREIVRTVCFPVDTSQLGTDNFRLDLNRVNYAQQVGQLVNVRPND